MWQISRRIAVDSDLSPSGHENKHVIIQRFLFFPAGTIYEIRNSNNFRVSAGAMQ